MRYLNGEEFSGCASFNVVCAYELPVYKVLSPIYFWGTKVLAVLVVKAAAVHQLSMKREREREREKHSSYLLVRNVIAATF